MVRLPGGVFTGETGTVHIELTSEKETKVDFIDVKLRGRQGWAVGSGQSSMGYTVDLPSLMSRVMDEGVLVPGVKTFTLQFAMPRNAAPSHTVTPAHSRLLIDVHVSIPWWPDGRYSFISPVRVPPPAQLERTPLVSRYPFTPKAGEPRIELSLASSTLVAGEAVVGSCALFHMADSKPRELDVLFEPMVRLLGTRKPSDVPGSGYRSSVMLPAGAAGEAVAFRIALPPEITPSFKTATHEISWFMKVGVGSLFGHKVAIRVPLNIVDARAASTLPALTLAPRVADERVLLAFERFASVRHMTVVSEELDRFPDEQPALVREIDDTTVRIGYAYRGEEGTFLVARVLYPRLGLGLSVTPSWGLRELVTRDITIGIAEWDRANHLDARDATQVTPFIRGTLPGRNLGKLVRWTDGELVTARSVGSVEEADLAGIALALEVFATTLASARQALAPPPGVAADLAEWQQLATRLGAPLTVGDLSIQGGTLELQPVDLGLVFDDEGRATAVRIDVGAPQAPDGAELPERVREMVAGLEGELREITVHAGVASASVPLVGGAADATRVREVVHALRAVVATLVETTGPYR